LVPSVLPGDPSYNAANAAVQLVRCLPGLNFDIADMPYTSAAEVQAGIAAGELNCSLGRVLGAAVVG
jgi:hypothetical protein